MYCTNCGFKLNQDDVFCSNCGFKVNNSIKEDNTIKEENNDANNNKKKFKLFYDEKN